jgi:hypothetical protein
MKLPKAEHDLAIWQAATKALIMGCGRPLAAVSCP